ncbi:hypothetical protein [uncultured Clostridium sp.]|jgi:uncharacterized protein with FMN-binding domain|uniref:hypothetical protein n=1 Tax=uncultured Clostridium sp. TaxID=59620 RepID=UPI00260384E0|nr:hypothetical protein [uncultured Clostridium sp.]
MKKYFKLLIIPLLFLTTFISCTHNKPKSTDQAKTIEENKSTNPQPTPSISKSPYKDGTFIGKSQITKRGQEESIVTIKNGRISAITLKVLDISGKEINYTLYTGQTIDNTFYPNINKYRIDFANSILNKQSTNIPDIKEIPEISSNWKISINNALSESKISKNK